MHICVYVYIYIYIYVHTYVCIHTYIYIYICVCIYIYIYIYIYIQEQTSELRRGAAQDFDWSNAAVAQEPNELQPQHHDRVRQVFAVYPADSRVEYYSTTHKTWVRGTCSMRVLPAQSEADPPAIRYDVVLRGGQNRVYIYIYIYMYTYLNMYIHKSINQSIDI